MNLKIKKIIETYVLINKDIQQRISEFKALWETAGEQRLFMELSFCLLTPQSKAENAWKTINMLVANNKLFKAESTSISEDLNLVRFKNNKARYITEARQIFFNSSPGIRQTLTEIKNVHDKRSWLKNNIKGYGLKEASHFLRNIGFVENISILDRHILKNLKRFNVINEIPSAISEKKYFHIENQMESFAKDIKIPVEYLDFIFWYMETNKIFK